jgi:hypothetical protein
MISGTSAASRPATATGQQVLAEGASGDPGAAVVKPGPVSAATARSTGEGPRKRGLSPDLPGGPDPTSDPGQGIRQRCGGPLPGPVAQGGCACGQGARAARTICQWQIIRAKAPCAHVRHRKVLGVTAGNPAAPGKGLMGDQKSSVGCFGRRTPRRWCGRVAGAAVRALPRPDTGQIRQGRTAPTISRRTVLPDQTIPSPRIPDRMLKQQSDRLPAGKLFPVREQGLPLWERETRPAFPPPARDAATTTRAACATAGQRPPGAGQAPGGGADADRGCGPRRAKGQPGAAAGAMAPAGMHKARRHKRFPLFGQAPLRLALLKHPARVPGPAAAVPDAAIACRASAASPGGSRRCRSRPAGGRMKVPASLQRAEKVSGAGAA